MKTIRKLAKWTIIAVTSLAGILLMYGLVVVVPRIKSKTDAAHAASLQSFHGLLREVGPEAQFESHTCGLHALRVIYKAYGLDPDRENLRVRLGVDIPANPIDPKSTGTLQPDMLRVLVQDHFDYTLVDLSDLSSAANTIKNHLSSGNMAAVLVSRRENGNMHWVAAKKDSDEKLVILDSLFPAPYSEEPHSFVRECILSCILVKPLDEQSEVKRAVVGDGARELRQTIMRYHAVKKTRQE